ncbi:MAG: Pr6Pr family membrane protein, partial [Micromonosporaceae bacterium]
VAGVSLWRLAIVSSAFIGFWEYASLQLGNLAYLTQQAAFFAGAVYLVLLVYPMVTRLQRHEPASAGWRGAAAVLLILVSATYATMLNGTYYDLGGFLSHLLTPLLVVLDWTFVGRNQGQCHWWHPFAWLVPPIAYLGFYLLYGELLYAFLDPSQPWFAVTVVQFLVTLLAVGYLLWGIARLKDGISRAIRRQPASPGAPLNTAVVAGPQPWGAAGPQP